MPEYANRMKACLVTGANGFIGKYLTDLLLAQGYQVRALTRTAGNQQVDTIIADLGTVGVPYAKTLAGIDTVFHLANCAHTRADAEQYCLDCEITLQLALQAQAAGVQRFIYVSSTRAMSRPGAFKLDESCTGWPSDSYGYWKRMTEQRLLDGINIPHLAIVRPCLVYGVGVKGNISRMIRAIHRGYFPPLPDTGAVRSMVSAKDVAAAMMLVAVNPAANRRAFIVADGEPYTAYSIYCAMLAAFGKRIPRMSIPVWLLAAAGRVGDLLRYVWPACPLSSEMTSSLIAPAAYSAQSLRQLGWEPTTTFYQELPAIVIACLESHS